MRLKVCVLVNTLRQRDLVLLFFSIDRYIEIYILIESITSINRVGSTEEWNKIQKHIYFIFIHFLYHFFLFNKTKENRMDFFVFVVVCLIYLILLNVRQIDSILFSDLFKYLQYVTMNEKFNVR